MPDYLGDDMRKPKKDDTEKEEKEIKCKFLLLLTSSFAFKSLFSTICMDVQRIPTVDLPVQARVSYDTNQYLCRSSIGLSIILR